MNQVLSQVRNLSSISHLMMLELLYPDSSNEFYAPILEFANFDLIDTEDLYEAIFGF